MKHMQQILLTIFLLTAGNISAQQSNFISAGKIEFERKLNLHSQYDDGDSWSEEFKKNYPKFKTTYFDLYFSDNKTLYRPGKEVADNNRLWEQPTENNIIFTDLEKQWAISQKSVFEKTFLVQDTLRRIKWKITDEKRTIAGFECRRANAVIMDSLYIVAFYTDEIATIGGPESFSGLPGMILGVAIPHEHITWFATKLYLVPVSDADLKAPVKGSKTTHLAMKDEVLTAVKRWGKWGQRYLKAALL